MTSALIVSRFFPYDEQRVHGVFQRLGAQVQALASVVDRVNCLFLLPLEQRYGDEDLRTHEERLRRLWSPAVSLRFALTINEKVPQGRWQRMARGVLDFHSQLIARPANNPATVAAVTASLDERPDIILAHRMSSMCVFMRIARQAPHLLRGRPLFFDMDDVEHVATFRRLVHDPTWPAERLLLLQVPRLILADVQAVRLATSTFVCSDADQRYLERLSHTTRVQTVPNSVAFPPVSGEQTGEPLALLVGAMGYRPNAQAADSLVRDIWPAVRARVPEARLAIVGAGRENTVSYHTPDPSVTFTGFVDDLASWYQRARLVCCPIYHGGGTRVKIIEAAAHAKAVVSTHIGAEGLNFQDGREIVLRDTPARIAEACAQLLRDPAAALRIGQAALVKARATYERAAVIGQLGDIFRSGLTEGPREQVAA